MSRTYGHLAKVGEFWQLQAEPHVLMMFKRVFTSLGHQFTTLRICHTPANVEMIHWLLIKYPLEMSGVDRHLIDYVTEQELKRRERCESILREGANDFELITKLPLRDYQMQAVNLFIETKGLLLGDDLGLGKTSVALGAMAAGLFPAIVVCKTHLQKQWVAEANKFLFGIEAHVVKKTEPYIFPKHNLLVISYSKLVGQADALRGKYRLVVYDEAQEVRRDESKKYKAAQAISLESEYNLGLSATPIYNYGDEIFNITQLLNPNKLGTLEEFRKEWCRYSGKHYVVKEPKALGTYLSEYHLFLRRRRADVGRELPPVIRISEEIEYNVETLQAHDDLALELAKTILRGTWNERGKAALELDAMMRLQTGLAKAPFVADFVAQMAESGESVILAGWHRDVYVVWQKLFEERGVTSRMYTGSESPAQKTQAAEDFIAGKVQVLILSLRSGEGLNGLQTRSNVIVFGELDWSPQVHEQCIGRLNRDESIGQVTAVYLYAGGGSDPVVAGVLGVKRSQSEGIINPKDRGSDEPLGVQAETARATALAKTILKRAGEKNEEVKMDAPLVPEFGLSSETA